jgi:N-hydroxyarylamine O-acetyltransferase
MTEDEWGVGDLDLGAYLDRIGCPAPRAATVAELARLHLAHVSAIPFENADIILGRGVHVDLASIQDKLVRRGRGGYCFEHGQLLAAALERLGYRVSRLLARVGGPRDARTHLVVRVHTGEGDWLADTGFGTGLLEPVPFGDTAPRTQFGWTYRLLPLTDHAWQLQERQGQQWVGQYQFDDVAQHHSGVVVANHFTSTYPSSSFVRQLVVIRKDATGLRRLTGRRMSVSRPGQPDTERQLGDDELAEELTQTFGLRLSPAETTRLAEATAGAHDVG